MDIDIDKIVRRMLKHRRIPEHMRDDAYQEGWLAAMESDGEDVTGDVRRAVERFRDREIRETKALLSGALNPPAPEDGPSMTLPPAYYAGLDDRERDMLKRHYEDGQSQVDIAVDYGVKVLTVKRILKGAREKIAEALENGTNHAK